MVEPVGRRLFPNPYWVLEPEDTVTPVDIKKDDAASPEVASLYYQSSIMSLGDPKVSAAKAEAAAKIESSQTQKSWFAKTKDWLWNLFGIAKKEALADTDSEAIDGMPQLAPPERRDSQRMKDTLADLNRDFVYRIKDIAEFEEEMRKSSGGQIDKLIFMQLVYSSLYQKDLKEKGSISAQQHLLELYNKNKSLKETYYDLMDEVINRTKTGKVLHWTNIGLTAGIVGVIAVSFATGGLGTVIGATGIALMNLGKGGTTLAEGILKYKNDRRTGEMHVVNTESKVNSKTIDDEMGHMQMYNDDIASLLKTIRHHLENQSRAERANFGHNT